MKTSSNRADIIKKRIAKHQGEFLKAYKNKDGNVSASCEAVNIARITFYEWRKKYKDFDTACQEIEDSLLDFSESALLKNIQDGKEASIFFFLVNRSKGKWQNIQKIENKFDDATTKKINEVFDSIAEAIGGGKKK